MLLKKLLEKGENKISALGRMNFSHFFKIQIKVLKNFFLPAEYNKHRPASLSFRSLTFYLITAGVIKLLVIGFLFFTYPTAAHFSEIISSRIIDLTNQARLERGLEPLKESSYLTTAAYLKGQDMISRHYFAHNTPEGKKPWQWINRGDYDYIYAGENLAMDFTEAEDVQTAFMKSPNHRRNILNPEYQEIGVAILEGKINSHKTILLVQFFGTTKKALMASVATSNTATDPPRLQDEVNFLNSAEPIVTTAGNNLIMNIQKNPEVSFWPGQVVKYLNIFFVSLLIFILLSLALNIFIHLKIQHPDLILQTIVALALITAISLINFHFLEQISPSLLIL